MVDLQNIKRFTVNRPDGWTILGNGETFDALPDSFKDQILYLDEAASKYIWEFSYAAHLLTGGGWDPFAKDNFKTVEMFTDFRRNTESSQLLTKWLYNRGLAFDNWVFILEDSSDQVILM